MSLIEFNLFNKSENAGLSSTASLTAYKHINLDFVEILNDNVRIVQFLT